MERIAPIPVQMIILLVSSMHLDPLTAESGYGWIRPFQVVSNVHVLVRLMIVIARSDRMGLALMRPSSRHASCPVLHFGNGPTSFSGPKDTNVR